jgi:manganese transport protein
MLGGAMLKTRLPTTATAPFCPSEVQGTIDVPSSFPFWKKLLLVAGPGLLVSVGYMDPGNWATDIEAGSKFGYSLLFVVLLSSLAAIVLQCVSLRIGLVTGRDLAQLCRDRYPQSVRITLWLLAEIAIIACDVAEVLGSALAFKLLFGCTMVTGIAITALDTVLVLSLKGRGFRQVEAIVLGLVLTIAGCFLIELIIVGPQMINVFSGFLPRLSLIATKEPLFLAVGIVGATVMPHNLYLHSSIVQTRRNSNLKESLSLAQVDTIVSLALAFFVNAAILILAAAAFHSTGHTSVTGIDDAYHLLDPIMGTGFASLLFAVALLASGQSSTFTGTIAGQVVLEGFLKLKIPCWQRRVITRALALVPAFIGIWWLGENSVGRLLVLSQVVLSFQLPFAIYPLIKFASDRGLMGDFRLGLSLRSASWALLALISVANVWLVLQLLHS